MSITHMPPSASSLEKARKYIGQKRSEIQQTRKHHQDMHDALLGTMGKLVDSMGAKGIHVGDTYIPLTEPRGPNHLVEARWTQALNEGKFVAMITAGNGGIGYHQDELVRMNDRTLDELVDADMIRRLAPGAVIYGAKDKSPWPGVISPVGFGIWVDSREAFDNLWAHAKDWMKTAWHDDTMKTSKYGHTAEQVFSVTAVYDIAPDLSWRQAQYLRAQAQCAQSEHEGQWNALAQAELKKMVSSALQMEHHPTLGGVFSQILEQITPMLANAIDGKARHKRLVEQAQKALEDVSKGTSSLSVQWQAWEPTSPIPLIPIQARSVRKPR